jgi:cytochrome P450
MSQSSALPHKAKPAHVPDALVYDFDVYAEPSYIADPHGRLLRLHHEAPPVFWSPANGGQWVMIGHEAIFNAARDWDTFTSGLSPQELQHLAAHLPQDGQRIPRSKPIDQDPPEHSKYRAPLNAVFSPKAMLALRDQIRELADSLIDQVIDQGRCDFMTAIAEPLPVQVFLKMLGLPIERQTEYRVLTRRLLDAIGGDIVTAAKILREIADTMRPTMLERRERPTDDMISRLWATSIDGAAVTLEDMEDWGVLLFIAGLDTVMQGMGFGVRHLAMDQPLQAKLREDPALIEDAREELLRRYTFTMPMRRVKKDTVYEGATMKAGEAVVLLLPAADLDPKAFPNPETFDLERENKVHIAFNSGPHRCVGSHLARVELQVLYEQLLSRLPPFRLDPDRPPAYHVGGVVGVDTLPLVW